jgi:hypothetical protein
MLKLILAGFIGLIFLSAFIIIIRNRPEIWFWLFVNLFFDPGGYVSEYLGGNLFGLLNITDIVIVGIVICLIHAKINWEVIFGDKFFLRFLLFLFIFSAYYLIVYGGVAPYLHNDFNYTVFLLKNRVFVYGLIVLISVYVFSLKGLRHFYTSTLFIGTICLSLYLITLLTGINLIPVYETPRYGHIGMMRISMASYGLFDLIFPLALIAYLLSRKINLTLNHKLWLYYSATVMLITLVITLTKRTQIDIISTVIIIILIISNLFRTGKLSEMLKLVVPVIIVILVLYFTFPKYIDYMITTGEDTFLLMTTGKNSVGEIDYRVTGSDELELTKEYIRNNLIIGTGYTYLYWGPGYATSLRGAKFALAADAAGEVPIYYLLFGFGIAGAVLMLPLYFMTGQLFFKLIKLLKLTLIDYLEDPITIIFSIYILLTIASKFTVNLYQLGSDFTAHRISYAAVLLGLGFALYRKIYFNIYVVGDK